MLGSFAADSAHRNALDFAPLTEVWELGLTEVSCREPTAGGHRRQQALGVSFYIVFADAPAGPGAWNFVNIYPNFARQPPNMRSCGYWPAVRHPSRPIQSDRHAEGGDGSSSRLFGRQRLLFGFSLGLNCGLKRHARFFLMRLVGPRGLLHVGCRRSPGIQCEDYLADFDLFSLLYQDIFDDPSHRRWHLDHGLVSLQLHHRLARRDR